MRTTFLILLCSLGLSHIAHAQTVEQDRIDSMNRATDTAFQWVGKSLEKTIDHVSKNDSEMNQYFSDLSKIETNALTLRQANARLEYLKGDHSSEHASGNDIQNEINLLSQQVAEMKANNNRLKEAKNAQFVSKMIGSSFAAISAWFQYLAIRDATRRVEIKMTELNTRMGGLQLDLNKLSSLQAEYESASRALNELKARGSTSDLSLSEASQRVSQVELELQRLKSYIDRTQESVKFTQETASIDARAIFRQKISTGITLVGGVIIALFGEKIILALEHFFESDNPKDQENAIVRYLKRRAHPTRVMYASLLPELSRSDSSSETSAVIFFMSSKNLGVKPGVYEKALERFKREAPEDYVNLKNTATWALTLESERELSLAKTQLQDIYKIRKHGFQAPVIYSEDNTRHSVADRPIEIN